MASGFIILNDGRCFSRHWSLYDAIIKLAVDGLTDNINVVEFKDWLQALLPGENDMYDGLGGFYRAGTDENVSRWLDLRELTDENQQLFWNALLVTQANEQFRKDNEYIVALLDTIIKMKQLADNNDPPENLSDWRDGYTQPPTGNHIGPGW